MLANATRLCEASYGILWRREGDQFRTGAFYGTLPPAYTERWRQGTLIHLDPEVPSVRAIKTRQSVQVADFAESRAYLDRDPVAVDGVEVAGIRTLVAVPMLRENEAIGSIAIAPKSGHSPRSRSSWSQTSPVRPSSRSRMRACSTSCANRCSSKPRPRRCCT